MDYMHELKEFLSTYPVRGTTRGVSMDVTFKLFLSTYPVRGTTTGTGRALYSLKISIHVPRAGYDR